MRVSQNFGDPLPEPTHPAPESSTPFRILVLADFGASDSWGRPRRVDRDNLEDIFAALKVRLDLAVDEGAPTVRFEPKEPEQLHPDTLFEELELFAALRTRRRRLQNSKTFEEESQAILAASGAAAAESEPSADDSPAPAVDTGSLLDQAIEQTPDSQKPLGRQLAEGSLNLDAYVRQLVEPYVVAKADPRQAEFVDGVDQAIAQTMRRVLHSEQFQRVESAWLGVKMLVRRLETDATLSIDVLNVSRDQLASDVTAGENLQSSQLYKLLVESTSVPGADAWTLVVGDYTFGPSAADTNVLGRIGRICASAGSLFVGGGTMSVVGCDDPAATPDPDDWAPPAEDELADWNELRATAEAANVALAAPRLLARLPYGAQADPIESFKFEEIPDGTAHGSYLWMNPAYGVATILGTTFSRAGWTLLKGWDPELDHLPTYVFKDGTESVMKPCGEIELVLRGGGLLASAGLTAVHSVRGRGAVLIPGLQSLATDGALGTGWS